MESLEKLRPNAKRAKTAITMIWLVLSIEVLMFFVDAFEFTILDRALNGNYLSEQEAVAYEIVLGLVALVFLAVFITSVVSFIQWFRRAYFNLHILVKNLDYTEG